MSDPSAERIFLERLAEEFAARCRNGERPSLTEYTRRYPQYAAQIRERLGALPADPPAPPPDKGEAPDTPGELPPGPPPPVRLGDYRILREIGRGGMGVVYEAVQESLHRHVALKVLPAPNGVINPAFLERFRREAQVAARLHHANIVPVYGTGEAGGVHFYAMQFIPGRGLDRVLEDLRADRSFSPGPENAPTVPIAAGAATLGAPRPDPDATAEYTGPPAGPPAELCPLVPRAMLDPGTRAGGAYFRGVARVGLQVAEALEYAHRQGVLHRDVKPSNLLLDPGGTVWVTDFGLAKVWGDERSRMGGVLGTLRYMAPERFGGTSLPHGDVYSLGLTLYELAARRPAFPERDPERLVSQILRCAPPPPRHIDPSIPRDLETIILKATARAPADRYPTAGHLAEDLRRFLADRPPLARRCSWAERAWRWRRRNPALSAALAALLLVLGLGLLGVSWKWREESGARAREKTAREEADARAAEVLDGLRRVRQAGALLERARLYADSGNWDNAEADLNRALALYPEYAPAWLERAELYTRLGLWDRAGDDLAEAFRRHEPPLPARWFWHALLRLEAGDRAGYRRAWERMRDRFAGTARPDFAAALVRTGALDPDPDGAAVRELAELAGALAEAHPRAGRYRYVRGLALYRAGEYAEAAAQLRLARAVEPGWAAREIAAPVLALAEFRRGRVAEARRALDDAARAIDGWTRALAAAPAGFAPIGPADWVECRRHFREAKRLLDGAPPPEDPRLLAVRGRALSYLGRKEEAQASYDRALALGLDDPALRTGATVNRAQSHVWAGRWAEAAAEFDRAVERLPGNADLWHCRAVARLMAGDRAGYRAACAGMCERFGATADPGDAAHTVAACVVLPDAVPDPERLLPLARVAAPGRHGNVRLLGAACYRAGRYAEALEHFAAAERLRKPRAADWAFRAMAHHRLGRHAEARRCLGQARRWVAQAERPDANDMTGTEPTWDRWFERREAYFLLSEAAALVEATPAAPAG